MELKMSNVIGAFVIFIGLVSLVSFIYDGFKAEYEITPTYTVDGEDIITKLNNIQIIDGLGDIIDAAYKVTTGSAADLIGALKLVGTGIMKTSLGILTAPIEIIGIITDFYYIPPNIARLTGILMFLAIGFMLIRYYIGDES